MYDFDVRIDSPIGNDLLSEKPAQLFYENPLNGVYALAVGLFHAHPKASAC